MVFKQAEMWGSSMSSSLIEMKRIGHAKCLIPVNSCQGIRCDPANDSA
jgi:hypothetical protein